jgi:hypothetical protein
MLSVSFGAEVEEEYWMSTVSFGTEVGGGSENTRCPLLVLGRKERKTDESGNRR